MEKKEWVRRIKEELLATHKEAEEFKELYTRLVLDFNKFKKRKEEEFKEAKIEGKKELIKKFFNAIDNLGRALEVMNENKSDAESLYKGVEMIYKQFLTLLKEEGGEIVEPKEGDDFDPEIHEAIDLVEVCDEKLNKKVIKSVQRGFKYMGKSISPARVIVGVFKEGKKESGSIPNEEGNVKEEETNYA
ncbi:MAG: nucleotide exchange factor GrpE [Candidatus Hydrothermales bacterium]